MWDRRRSLINELSGGQRQRVSVARALAQEATVLLLDEPFRGVDVASQAALVSVLMRLRDEGLAITVLVIIFGLGKELVYASFDPTGCSVIGLPTEKLEYLLLGMLAVVVVLTLYAVGIVLVISMLITPAATALLLVRNFGGAAVVGAVIGIASVIAGLYISYYYNMPPSPIMALVASFIFLVALGWKQGVAGFIQHRRARHV